MGRDRKYASDADRQHAYRQRKAEEEARLREELRRAKSEGGIKAATRKAVSVKLVKVLGYLGSDSAGERDNAARKAMEILKAAGLTWYDVLDTEEGTEEMSTRKFKEIALEPSGHVGVQRARNGKGWEAYVLDKDVTLLGVFATKRQAVAARAKYWKAKDRRAA